MLRSAEKRRKRERDALTKGALCLLLGLKIKRGGEKSNCLSYGDLPKKKSHTPRKTANPAEAMVQEWRQTGVQ